MLIHGPYGGREGRLGAWKALVEAQKAGRVRSIGVSNYGIRHLEELEDYIKNGGGGEISVGQYELHPWCGRVDLCEWLRKRNVVIQAYSPLVQATRMNEPSLQNLVKKHKKTPAQVLLRWNLQKVWNIGGLCYLIIMLTLTVFDRDLSLFPSLSPSRVSSKTHSCSTSNCPRRIWTV